MQTKIPLKGGDEQDAFTGWRRLLRWRPGERKKIKQGYNKRLRKALKAKDDRVPE